MDADRRRAVDRVAWISLAVLAGGFLLLLQACFGTTEAPAPPASERLSSPQSLNPFFMSLAAIDARTSREPVRVMQIGDSHSANDSLSGRLRDRLQARFGDAGRGWLPAGVPYKYYRPHQVGIAEHGWRHVKPSDHEAVALGLDAVAAESQPVTGQSTGADMTIESTDPAGFDRFAVEFLTRPDGPPFAVAVDGGAPERVSTAAAMPAIRIFDRSLDRPARQVALTVEGRSPVVLLGWTVERRAPGIVYENHGTIGATIGLIGQMTPEAMSFELAERRPALLVVAFGTNEGFDDDLDIGRYGARFQDAVTALQRAAHGAPVLLLGTPDGNRAAKGCAATPCGTEGDACAWREPPKLAAVRDAQRRVAAQHGWAYWDWFAAMGGRCA
ncbi:MAG TPA: GDSL-type esterase/lipase family protein, partial [Stellaceae bacterium]|nr:GDSL-type esterase/lipase family protein [Stellaceae bacterium]